MENPEMTTPQQNTLPANREIQAYLAETAKGEIY